MCIRDSIIARLANLSLEHATFPAKFKIAQVTPLLKKQGIDTRDPSSYRPISNLNTVSKVIERLVLARIVPHVTSSPNFDGMQSAYRTKHSTETALLKITNDVYEDLDQHQSTLLVVLDQSAAFDCIDHSTMIRMTWMTSYLSDRSFYVHWGNTSSSKLHVNTGVPQGSVFQSACCSVVTCAQFLRHQTSPVCWWHTNLHFGIQVGSVRKSGCSPTMHRRCPSLATLNSTNSTQLLSNGLQLNPSKSDVIQFVTGRGRERVLLMTLHPSKFHILLNNHPVLSSVGVTLDKQLSFDSTST